MTARIKHPFWQMTDRNNNAIYVCINYEEDIVPVEIRDRSICINGDIGVIIDEIQNNQVNILVNNKN